MSIKSDNWIRRMARDHRMIEPFEPGQVRSSENGRLISYGTSSYGYDVRCASEFKIFTNINSTIVDPKRFDEKSFVDMTADVCIIPPNSFALARTVEYFRIPRTVLTVCLGKCVTGDTRVVDAETGAYVPITQMRFGKSTLAMDEGRLRAAKVADFVPQGVREVFELRTRAGLRIRATANHPFRKPDRWVPLSELKIGDRIASAREVPLFGRTALPDWEATLLGLVIGAGLSEQPGRVFEHTAIDPLVVRLLDQALAESTLGAAARILDSRKVRDWLQRHALNVASVERVVPQSIFTATEHGLQLFLRALFSSGGSIVDDASGPLIAFQAHSRTLAEDIHHLLLRFGVFSLLRPARIGPAGSLAVQIEERGLIERFAARVGFVPGSIKQQQLLRLLQSSARSDAKAVLGHGRGGAASSAESSGTGPLWDVIESLEAAGSEPVFDISVPGLHNFLANGLIVHNSTYARCFRGDTRVALVDGSSASLEQMARRHEQGEPFRGYSLDPQGRVIVTRLHQPRFIGRDALLELSLDNGERVHATPDHAFLKRDGSFVIAAELRAGDALMPLYRQLRGGQQYIYQPREGAFRPDAPALTAQQRRLGAAGYLNHTVVAIRELPGDHDVYCLTVPQAGNFALAAGVFVHNCGIIVNVTPLEPEWEGHVTLEFSNTTPLPAKIYANEGVAQMLFFESDEVCSTSYADRGGKYQGQKGVTLPKA